MRGPGAAPLDAPLSLLGWPGEVEAVNQSDFSVSEAQDVSGEDDPFYVLGLQLGFNFQVCFFSPTTQAWSCQSAA